MEPSAVTTDAAQRNWLGRVPNGKAANDALAPDDTWIVPGILRWSAAHLVTDRAEFDPPTDKHRERELQCEPHKDNGPHRCHVFITPQAHWVFRAACPRSNGTADRTNHELVGKPRGIGCAGVEHSRSLPEYIYCPGSPVLQIPLSWPMAGNYHAEGRGRLRHGVA